MLKLCLHVIYFIFNVFPGIYGASNAWKQLRALGEEVLIKVPSLIAERPPPPLPTAAITVTVLGAPCAPGSVPRYVHRSPSTSPCAAAAD